MHAPGSPRHRLALFVVAGLAIACSGSGDDDQKVPDRDGGVRDSGVVADAGVRAFCPVAANMPTCNNAQECEDARDPQPDCMSCPKDNGTLCLLGHCSTPPAIPPGNSHVYSVAIAGFEAEVTVLVGLAVAAESAGGEAMTCAEATALAWSEWNQACYNVLRSRYLKIQTIAQVYNLSFANFASGQKVLFLAYGFADETTLQGPIGVTCSEYQVGEPGDGIVAIMGDNLNRIQ